MDSMEARMYMVRKSKRRQCSSCRSSKLSVLGLGSEKRPEHGQSLNAPDEVVSLTPYGIVVQLGAPDDAVPLTLVPVDIGFPFASQTLQVGKGGSLANTPRLNMPFPIFLSGTWFWKWML